MTKQYKEEDIIIYYEGDKTTQLVPNGIVDNYTGETYHGVCYWHVAVRSGEGVVKFIPPRYWNVTHNENPSFQIMDSCTENLIKPLEFFTKKALQEICSLKERINLDPKDTKKKIIDKIRKTAVPLFNEIERKSNPDIWNIGEVVIRDNRLPCVIVDKKEVGLEVAFFPPLAGYKEGRSDYNYPEVNTWDYSEFDKLEDANIIILTRIFKEYVSAISTYDNYPVFLSREFLEIQITSYGEKIYDQHSKHMIITRVEKEKEKEKKFPALVNHTQLEGYNGIGMYFNVGNRVYIKEFDSYGTIQVRPDFETGITCVVLDDGNHLRLNIYNKENFFLCFDEYYGIDCSSEFKQEDSKNTIEVDMRDINDIIESMNDAIDFIKSKSGPSLDDQTIWKNLQRSIARIEATMKYGPH